MYKPANGTSRREIPYRSLVNSIDPELERAKHHEVEYDFPRHWFYADPDKRGAFNSYSNVYPVGQAHD